MTNQITRAIIIHYMDNCQIIAHVHWADGSQTAGDPKNTHMQALLDRAKREGKYEGEQTW